MPVLFSSRGWEKGGKKGGGDLFCGEDLELDELVYYLEDLEPAAAHGGTESPSPANNMSCKPCGIPTRESTGPPREALVAARLRRTQCGYHPSRMVS